VSDMRITAMTLVARMILRTSSLLNVTFPADRAPISGPGLISLPS
jgi:hypothetical protein